MRAEHERAAALIFESRNGARARGRGGGGGGGGPSSSLPSSSLPPSPLPSSSVVTLDLHGLHVSEGVAVVERAVARARGQSSSSSGSSSSGNGGAAVAANKTKKTALNLILGVGRHTTHGAGRVARLPLAVKSRLDELDVEWEEGRVEGMVTAFV